MKEQPIDAQDAELRKAYAALRAADGLRAPAFSSLLQRPRPSRRRLAWSAAALASLAVAVALGLAWLKPPATPHPASLPAVMFVLAADMPSDFLLETPTRDVRREAPRVLRKDNDEVPFL